MKKILIVDDQMFIREVFKKQIELLENVGVLEAANGNEAMGKVKVVKPDLILLDIVMPGKDGLEVLKELHDDVDTRDIPVIIISSHAGEDKIATAKSFGAREFIDKAQLNNIDFNGLISKYLGM
ncbi:MAG: Two component transcriptional regulator, winged helix family [candidate division CPR2 bacterium GW2011_GWC1_41_48]|uniref:Two component transcriptional regulator, winged helix family n=1 Tax=candidate division CPR2 bacterium GW2011_GWC1_41_48 TaxID=1618344 RepID=A0A0G0Z6J0_UNCC2|nr:MAG: Two component transcriptional regulator, winged helix family [candidate division CPR2 bacterium GW2011_GWC2_39_35]KKR27319.1 MAG: Two component transcriptional regulator, winged helix family [candidate division CPR2 bacterium GW2011_GWD1_39_7]KKR27648.1 MAG: Two component transcriptional regulator, winged helix family [candidate division CPR2 bacterium GW2011_GWD2_39_7]KKS08643.1 MAG: Two component transcriptional regulator, winged helix family [candidate division CPR2 bacterium GW2011_G